MDQLPPAPLPARGSGPANLTVPLAAWLRKLSFAVRELGGVAPSGLTANWPYRLAGVGGCFYFDYAFGDAGGTVHLGRSFGQPPLHELLVRGATVLRLREARFLLLSSQPYAEARRAALAAGTLRPRHSAHPAP